MCNEVIRWELFPNQNWFGWSLVFYTMRPYNSLHGSWFLCPQVQKTKQNKKTEPNNLCNNFLLQNSINQMSAVLSHSSHVLLFATRGQNMEWVVISYSRDLPDSGIKPESLTSPALAGRFFAINATWGIISSLQPSFTCSCSFSSSSSSLI